MNVLMVSGSVDIGGQGARFAKAFADDKDWSLRSVVKDQSYLAYPLDVPWKRSALDELYQACDVFHARINFGLYDQLAAKFGPKPVILHGHGSAYRADPNRYVREAKERGAVIVVSTLDLWLLAPDDSIWLPAPYDLDWLAEMTVTVRGWSIYRVDEERPSLRVGFQKQEKEPPTLSGDAGASYQRPVSEPMVPTSDNQRSD